MKHFLPAKFRSNPLFIDLVGCGGTGSRLLVELADLHTALVASGHPRGLQVNVYDPDTVSASNMARGRFYPADIGKSKALQLTTRVNVCLGLQWDAYPLRYSGDFYLARMAGPYPPDLVITAVDTLKARAELYRQMTRGPLPPPRYWLDCGNDVDTGQVILGELEWESDPFPRQGGARPMTRLRNLVDLFPDMLDRADCEEPDPPSCTLGQALDRQGLGINGHVAKWSRDLLWYWFRDGALEWHGVFINARSGRVNPIPVRVATPAETVAGPIVGLPAELRERRVRARRRPCLARR